MAYDHKDIDRLKNKAGKNMYSNYLRKGTVYRNIDSDCAENESINPGFALRAVVSLCLIAAFVVCKLNPSEKAAQTFSAIVSEISVNRSIDDLKEIIP